MTRDATASVEAVRALAASAAAAASSSSLRSDESFEDPGTAAAAAAYRAGVALALSERLRATSGVFDRARAARYAAAASEREGKEAALRRAAAKAAAAAPLSKAAAGAPFDFSSSSAAPSSPSQQQVQMQMQAPRQQTINSATAALLAEISSQAADVARAEATARELASLNRAFAGAVATQAEAIEALYESALVSVANVKRGNVQLRKANAAGAGARRWVFVALLVAALAILLADWLSS